MRRIFHRQTFLLGDRAVNKTAEWCLFQSPSTGQAIQQLAPNPPSESAGVKSVRGYVLMGNDRRFPPSFNSRLCCTIHGLMPSPFTTRKLVLYVRWFGITSTWNLNHFNTLHGTRSKGLKPLNTAYECLRTKCWEENLDIRRPRRTKEVDED